MTMTRAEAEAQRDLAKQELDYAIEEQALTEGRLGRFVAGLVVGHKERVLDRATLALDAVAQTSIPHQVGATE